jgi:hypothetical protein
MHLHRHIVRCRAQKRLDAIWQRLGGAHTRYDVRKLVQEDDEIAWKVSVDTTDTAEIDAEDGQQVQHYTLHYHDAHTRVLSAIK